jgi:hypothetical protein
MINCGMVLSYPHLHQRLQESIMQHNSTLLGNAVIMLSHFQALHNTFQVNFEGISSHTCFCRKPTNPDVTDFDAFPLLQDH